ncbi:hypothetical protein KJ671_04180, partial [Patescibacteria group bacterium]|nr:hypothetical protein [Patescibacteria group bacterium]
IPGQTNPHSTCVNNVCTSNNICGFTDCSSCGGGGCPLPGQTNPHSICVNDVCISNNICGFTDCSGCGGSCVIPGQTNPHSTCVNNVCTSNNICGFTDCSSCGGVCIPTPGICNEKTCADVDDCDPPVPCVVCDFGFGCVGEEGAGVCELCIDCEEEGKVCGDDNGCGNVCQNCPVGESCVEQVDDSWKCETQGSGLILIGVEPAGANN